MLLRLSHILLACLLLIGSTGLVLNKHYCQNELKRTALFLPAKACHPQNKKVHCPMHAGTKGHSEKEERNDCCHDQTEYLKADQDQISPSFALDLQEPLIPGMSLFVPLQTDPSSIDHQTLHYLNYKPPLIVRDLSVRFQIFRC